MEIFRCKKCRGNAKLKWQGGSEAEVELGVVDLIKSFWAVVWNFNTHSKSGDEVSGLYKIGNWN